MTDEIRHSNTDLVGYGWKIFHLGSAATKEQLQSAFAVVLRRQERDAARLKMVEPFASAVEAMIEKALEEERA